MRAAFGPFDTKRKTIQSLSRSEKHCTKVRCHFGKLFTRNGYFIGSWVYPKPAHNLRAEQEGSIVYESPRVAPWRQRLTGWCNSDPRSPMSSIFQSKLRCFINSVGLIKMRDIVLTLRRVLFLANRIGGASPLPKSSECAQFCM